MSNQYNAGLQDEAMGLDRIMLGTDEEKRARAEAVTLANVPTEVLIRMADQYNAGFRYGQVWWDGVRYVWGGRS